MSNTQTITKYIVREFLPDVEASDLPPDYDLLRNGVIDSLALLRVVDWIAAEFDVSIEDLDLSPDNFRTVENIDALVASAKS
ncbi:acyl carrier protein [Actinophytocola sp.]|jgi:acyl carrier protein|uniref:acyl carrier protein n=1 Tax=Actinophytocola sp. TaxID=1872138 RepID=UPI002D3461C2|nr:acyl carrier protein [Actinophytocola sp.]HYQ64045.1 acyl carrier protein [Actinophytocola sp.]